MVRYNVIATQRGCSESDTTSKLHLVAPKSLKIPESLTLTALGEIGVRIGTAVPSLRYELQLAFPQGEMNPRGNKIQGVGILLTY